MSASPQPWNAANYLVAGGIGIYIVGITWFARREAAQSSKIHLLGGLITMLAGIVMLWSFPNFLMNTDAAFMFEPRSIYWTLLWLALIALIGWRFVRALIKPTPPFVQSAIKTGIISIIVLDAAVVFGVRGCWPAIAVLLLLLPAIFLGRWVYST
jgi:4-hydroxybenzoate polyprenyltransferase